MKQTGETPDSKEGVMVVPVAIGPMQLENAQFFCMVETILDPPAQPIDTPVPCTCHRPKHSNAMYMCC